MLELVWATLTDYANLATVVPNLVSNDVIRSDDDGKGARLQQAGHRPDRARSHQVAPDQPASDPRTSPLPSRALEEGAASKRHISAHLRWFAPPCVFAGRRGQDRAWDHFHCPDYAGRARVPAGTARREGGPGLLKKLTPLGREEGSS